MIHDRYKFYAQHLTRVSRSFAYCIEQLSEPFRSRVALTYLLCRILDTLEDAPWSHPKWQSQLFNNFTINLKGPDFVELELMSDFLISPLPAGEAQLLQDQKYIFSDFHQLAKDERNIIFRTVSSMSCGMQYFSELQRDNVFRIQDLQELNYYCFFVAGIIGEALTLLFQKNVSHFIASQNTLESAVEFGLFLQKVNILKDQSADEVEGRFFVPDRVLLVASLGDHADAAFDYLTQIPIEEHGYRTFCAWSLFLGLFSIPRIEHAFKTNSKFQIPRLETLAFLKSVEKISSDNEILKKRYLELKYLANLPGVHTHLKYRRDPEQVQSRDCGVIHLPPLLQQCYSGVLPLTKGQSLI